VKLLNISIQVW